MFVFTSQGAAAGPIRRHRRRALRVPIALALASVIGAGAGADVAAAAPAPVPCYYAGSGHYNCEFYPWAGAPVQQPSGRIVGTLHRGTNWVICQRAGSVRSSGGYYNDNWAWTLADNNTWGWVNAVFARGGDNYGRYGGGVPDCGSAYGNPPYTGGGGGRTPWE